MAYTFHDTLFNGEEITIEPWEIEAVFEQADGSLMIENMDGLYYGISREDFEASGICDWYNDEEEEE